MNRSGGNLQRRHIVTKSQQIWISHMDQLVLFTQKAGYEKKAFSNIKELIDFVNDYVEKGYKVG